MEEQTHGAARGPDAIDALMRARQVESQALAEYTRVLQMFTDLAMHGTAPEQPGAVSNGGVSVREVSVISIVDDDESVREATKTLLRSAGYQVRTFTSAENLLNSGALGETGCLILDVRMPGIDGPEFQRRLNAEGCCVPIIFITAHDDGTLRRRVVEAGAVDLLNKPFAASTLLATVETALKARKAAPRGKRRARVVTPGPGKRAEDNDRSTIIVITPIQEDCAALRDVLGLLEREVVSFRTLREAIGALGRASVVLCDAELPDGGWRDVMRSLETIADPPLLIVAAHLADNRLWAEVLNEGGHDVLAKPFRAAEVLQTVTSGFRWRESRQRKRPGLELSRTP